jgi:phage-related protein
MGIFGRAGMQLAPLLNQGSAGIAKFGEEAKKMGLVLSQDNLNAVQKNIMAQREFHASVQGLQVQLGQYLYPAITAITKGFSEIVPILTQVLRPAFKMIGEILQPLVGYIQEGAKFLVDLGLKFQSTGEHASMFASIGKSLGTVFNDFKTLLGILLPILKDLWTFIMTYLAPVLLDVLTVAFKGVSIAANIVVDAIKIVVALLKGLVTVAKDVGIGIKDAFSFIVNGVKGYINGIIALVNVVIDMIDKIHFKLPDWVPGLGGKEFGINIPKIPMLAEGGIVTKPTLAMIGEAGAEAVVPLNKGYGQAMNVTIQVQGSVISEGQLINKVRDGLAQTMRRKGVSTSVLGI